MPFLSRHPPSTHVTDDGGLLIAVLTTDGTVVVHAGRFDSPDEREHVKRRTLEQVASRLVQLGHFLEEDLHAFLDRAREEWRAMFRGE